MRRIGLIILAAGASSRMGQPKQLLVFEGQSLIRRAIETALASICRPIVVVLGAQAAQIQNELADLPVTVIHNPQWETGMGSSIKKGLEALGDNEANSEAALFMLSDQPYLTPVVLNQLAVCYLTHGGIVASAYNNTLGVPAVFGKDFHAELISLPPGHGAKRVMEQHRENVHAIDFPEGMIDIDTPQDYEQLSHWA